MTKTFLSFYFEVNHVNQYRCFITPLISQACRYDYVEIRDKEEKVLGKFCGGRIPQIVASSSNVMWVEFKSDHTQSRKGFTAFYYAGIYLYASISKILWKMVVNVDLGS